MPRSGQNPLRWIRRRAPAPELTLTTVVCIPELTGYWAQSLEVLDLCLESLRRTAGPHGELLVLDNASCDEVRRFLEERYDAGAIDQLVLSRRNLGKVGGWNLLFAAAEGELVAYADSDVYFLPGWLEASRAVLEAFPEAAMVTAQPLPGDLSRHCRATLEGARADPGVTRWEGDDLIPELFVESHRRGLGESRERYGARLGDRREVRLERGAVRAYVSASHFQFLSRRATLERFFPLPTHVLLGDDPELDARLDEAGCWRLSTIDYLVHHMGNRRPDLAGELPWLELPEPSRAPAPRPARTSSRFTARLFESPRLRRLLKALHTATWNLLYPS